jgi:beta-glucosidase
VDLNHGEPGHVRLLLDGRSLSYWDATKHDWAEMPGNYQAMVGASSRDIRLHGQLIAK